MLTLCLVSCNYYTKSVMEEGKYPELVLGCAKRSVLRGDSPEVSL